MTIELTIQQTMQGWRAHDRSDCVPAGIVGAELWQAAYMDSDDTMHICAPTSERPENADWTLYRAYRTFEPSPANDISWQSMVCEACAQFASEPDPYEQYDLIDAISSQHAHIRALKSLLNGAPVMSKYHGMNGFEDNRFISDYEEWRKEVREILKDGQ